MGNQINSRVWMIINGPEAKKQVDETWLQVQDINRGLDVGNIEKARKLIQDKSGEVKKFGDQAWQKGMEQCSLCWTSNGS